MGNGEGVLRSDIADGPESIALQIVKAQLGTSLHLTPPIDKVPLQRGRKHAATPPGHESHTLGDGESVAGCLELAGVEGLRHQNPFANEQQLAVGKDRVGFPVQQHAGIPRRPGCRHRWRPLRHRRPPSVRLKNR